MEEGAKERNLREEIRRGSYNSYDAGAAVALGELDDLECGREI